jgi:DNA-binding MarR family transcriptional regulator
MTSPATEDAAREVWKLLSALVLDNTRRRDVTKETGLSFSRSRALRRLARQPMSMGELAAALGIDPPNATVLVDDLETQGLARRKPHPTDRRTKLVEPTRKGNDIARRANEILSTPPPGLSALSTTDLNKLQQILQKAQPESKQ